MVRAAAGTTAAARAATAAGGDGDGGGDGRGRWAAVTAANGLVRTGWTLRFKNLWLFSSAIFVQSCIYGGSTPWCDHSRREKFHVWYGCHGQSVMVLASQRLRSALWYTPSGCVWMTEATGILHGGPRRPREYCTGGRGNTARGATGILHGRPRTGRDGTVRSQDGGHTHHHPLPLPLCKRRRYRDSSRPVATDSGDVR